MFLCFSFLKHLFETQGSSSVVDDEAKGLMDNPRKYSSNGNLQSAESDPIRAVHGDDEVIYLSIIV